MAIDFSKLRETELIELKLEHLYWKFEDKFGSPYRKYDESIINNNLRVMRFLKELVAAIKRFKDFDKINQEVLDLLEDENFHTLCLAIEIAQGKTTITDNLYRYDRRNEIY